MKHYSKTFLIATHAPIYLFFDMAMPWSSLGVGLKKDPYHVVHNDNHTFKQKINNHIFNSSYGGFLNHSQGLNYIVTKSRCTMALTPPGWNSQNLSNQISRTESYQEAMTTALVKLAKRNKWKLISSI